MSPRAKVLIVLGMVDVALIALVVLAGAGIDDVAARKKSYDDRHQVLSTLVAQEKTLADTFEGRLPKVLASADRDSMASLYDKLGGALIADIPQLHVKGVSYDFNASTNYAKLTVTIPVDTSPFESLSLLLSRIEKLQDENWLSIQGLTVESRQTPVEGVAGSITLVLYFLKG